MSETNKQLVDLTENDLILEVVEDYPDGDIEGLIEGFMAMVNDRFYHKYRALGMMNILEEYHTFRLNYDAPDRTFYFSTTIYHNGILSFSEMINLRKSNPDSQWYCVVLGNEFYVINSVNFPDEPKEERRYKICEYNFYRTQTVTVTLAVPRCDSPYAYTDKARDLISDVPGHEIFTPDWEGGENSIIKKDLSQQAAIDEDVYNNEDLINDRY